MPAGAHTNTGGIIQQFYKIHPKEFALLKITDSVFQVAGIVANPFIIVDADGLSLIAAGMPRNEKPILAYVASLGKPPRDLKRILLTHSDLDHVGSRGTAGKAVEARARMPSRALSGVLIWRSR